MKFDEAFAVILQHFHSIHGIMSDWHHEEEMRAFFYKFIILLQTFVGIEL